MLQQTKVSRVESFFVTWMKHYPTLSSLAQATLHEVLVLWKGLGYPRRAKSLLAISKEYSKIPKTFEGLCALPGVGPYTASAVCAFAYNEFSHPVLETNIRTTLIHYFHHSRKKSIGDDILLEDLYRIMKIPQVKNLGARHWYYALMDYGAMLKEKKISYNSKSKLYRKQSVYKGSRRELRAHVLQAIGNRTPLPKDERLPQVLEDLSNEGFIIKKKKRYSIA